MLCPVCKTNEATRHPTLGVLPCEVCRDRQKANRVLEPVEFTSQEIKEGRKQYKDEIIQPFRSGEVSKEYIDKYGYQRLGITKEEADKAKNVWSDSEYY